MARGAGGAQGRGQAGARVLRLIRRYLQAGVMAAVNHAGTRTATIFAGAEQNASHIFQIRSYPDLYGDLYKLGVLPLGVVFYYHQRQAIQMNNG